MEISTCIFYDAAFSVPRHVMLRNVYGGLLGPRIVQSEDVVLCILLHRRPNLLVLQRHMDLVSEA